MLSSWQIWDFFQSYPAHSWHEFKNPIGISSFDSLSLRWMREHILKGLKPEEKPQMLIGGEIDLDFLSNQMDHLDLFGETKKFLLLHPDDLKNDCKNYLLEKDFTGGEPLFVLAFHQDSAFQKKWAQKAKMIQIEVPRFWENQKLIDFLASYFRLQLTLEAKKLILESVEPQLMNLAPILRNIKLLYPENRLIHESEVAPLLEYSRIDQFQLASLLGKRKFSDFFEKMNQIPFDYNKYRLLFNFLLGHFIKVYDPSYLQEKKRLSLYDKEIQHVAQSWEKSELEELIKFLSQLEMACKMKYPMVFESLLSLSLHQQAYHLNPLDWGRVVSFDLTV
jgi:DNA polymerase III delta subunit